MNPNPEFRIDTVRNYVHSKDKLPLKDFLKKHKLNKSTFYKLYGQVELIDKMVKDTKPEIRIIMERLSDAVSPVLSEEALEAKKIQEMDDAMFEAGKGKKSSKYAELWYKRQGVLIDKQEVDVTVGLSADEIAQRNLEADRQLQEFNRRTS